MTNAGPSTCHHIFVMNNYTERHLDMLKEWGAELLVDPSRTSYPINNRVHVTLLAFQLEAGEADGTPHIQGYLQTNLKTGTYKLTDKLQEYFGVRPHVEACKKSSDTNLDYVSKEDTRQAGTVPYVFGTAVAIPARGGQGQRTDLDAVQEDINLGTLTLLELKDKYFAEFCKFERFLTTYFTERQQRIQTDSMRSLMDGSNWRFPWQADLVASVMLTPQPRRISWWWEAQGNVGKSYMARYLALHCDSVVVQAMKKADLLHLLTKTLLGARCVVFDLTRTTEDGSVNVVYEVLEQLSNGYICSGKYDSTSLFVQPLHLICFANFAPDRSTMSADRWDVHHIGAPMGSLE